MEAAEGAIGFEETHGQVSAINSEETAFAAIKTARTCTNDEPMLLLRRREPLCKNNQNLGFCILIDFKIFYKQLNEDKKIFLR